MVDKEVIEKKVAELFDVVPEKTRIERKNLSPEEKARIDAGGKKKKEPWYLSYAGLTCIAWIIIGIIALIFAPQLIFLVLHG